MNDQTQSVEEKTAAATVAIIRAIENLPPNMAAVAFQNANRVVEAGKRAQEIGNRLDELAAKRKTQQRGWRK